jgi:hypothetical protein
VAYRDNLDAALARVASLQGEVETLRRTNAELRSAVEEKPAARVTTPEPIAVAVRHGVERVTVMENRERADRGRIAIAVGGMAVLFAAMGGVVPYAVGAVGVVVMLVGLFHGAGVEAPRLRRKRRRRLRSGPATQGGA